MPAWYAPFMRLADYIALQGITVCEMARRVGVSAAAMSRYRGDLRLPEKPILERIYRATKGAVGPADFYDLRLTDDGEAALD